MKKQALELLKKYGRELDGLKSLRDKLPDGPDKVNLYAKIAVYEVVIYDLEILLGL